MNLVFCNCEKGKNTLELTVLSEAVFLTEGSFSMKKQKNWLILTLLSFILLISELSVLYTFKDDVQNKLTGSFQLKKLIEIQHIYAMKTIDIPIPEIIIEEPVAPEPIKTEVQFPTFEETIETTIDGWGIVNNPHSDLVVLNKSRKLPEGFVPELLTIPNVKFAPATSNEKRQLKFNAAIALENMFSEAENNKIILYGVSAYRSFERQNEVYAHHIQTKGEKRAKAVSAYPGSSEHQTGLSIDISAENQGFNLTTSFGDTAEGIWVANNAHLYGFIIRYPNNKSDITGYSYEPWHLRYVGIQHAIFLFEHNLTFEEVDYLHGKTPSEN